MRAIVLAVAFLLVTLVPAQAQHACKGSSSLVYSDTVSFFLAAPRGWTLDCEAGRNDGALTVLYRVGESWRDGQAVMYASIISLPPGVDLPITKRIEAEVRDWKDRAPDAVVTEGKPIRTAAGVAVPVRRFVSKGKNLHEIVAYIPRGRDVPILVMTARSSREFENALPAFEALVHSYAVGPEIRQP
jgi:hypothetical protein